MNATPGLLTDLGFGPDVRRRLGKQNSSRVYDSLFFKTQVAVTVPVAVHQ